MNTNRCNLPFVQLIKYNLRPLKKLVKQGFYKLCQDKMLLKTAVLMEHFLILQQNKTKFHEYFGDLVNSCQYFDKTGLEFMN